MLYIESKQGIHFAESQSGVQPAAYPTSYSQPRYTPTYQKKWEVPVWDQLQNLVNDGQTNAAYKLCFSKGDDMMLIRLMGRTGVCIETMSDENLDKILNSITTFLNEKSFIDVILPWLWRLAVIIS